MLYSFHREFASKIVLVRGSESPLAGLFHQTPAYKAHVALDKHPLFLLDFHVTFDLVAKQVFTLCFITSYLTLAKWRTSYVFEGVSDTFWHHSFPSFSHLIGGNISVNISGWKDSKRPNLGWKTLCFYNLWIIDCMLTFASESASETVRVGTGELYFTKVSLGVIMSQINCPRNSLFLYRFVFYKWAKNLS